MSKSSRPYDEAVQELLREDPAFADEYLSVAKDEAGQLGGSESLLVALHNIAASSQIA